jgi:hypothetical protein
LSFANTADENNQCPSSNEQSKTNQSASGLRVIFDLPKQAG